MIRQKWLLLQIIVDVILMVTISLQAQTILQSRVNTITTTQGIRHRNQMAVLSPDSVFIVFKRGEGASRADNTIIAALSFDGGKTFREVDVTEALYDGITNDFVYEVDDPRISATSTSIVVMFEYGVNRAFILRSTDGGETWTDTVASNSIDEAMGQDFFSDGESTYIATNGYQWVMSIDDGVTFDTLKGMPSGSGSVRGMAVSPGNIWTFTTSASTEIRAYYSYDKGTSFAHIGTFNADLPSLYNFPTAAHGDSVFVAYIDEQVGIYKLKWHLYATTGIVDSGLIYEGTTPPAGTRDGAFMNEYRWALEAAPAGEILASSDHGKTWGPQVKPNLAYDALSASSFHLVDSISYNIGNAYGQIPAITFWKWKITNVPVVDILTDSAALAAISNKDTAAIWLEIISYVGTSERLQIATDEEFTNTVLDSVMHGKVAFSVLPADVGLSFNTTDKNFYVRLRTENDTSQTGWSTTLVINFAHKNTAPIKFASTGGNNRNAFCLKIFGRRLQIVFPEDDIQAIRLFDIRGRLAIADVPAQHHYTDIDISSLSPGQYVVSAIGSRSSYNRKIAVAH